MTDFPAKASTLDANWRAVVIFGRNVASYKFALARTLLGLADRPNNRVTLEELAAPFAQHFCKHLKLIDKQTTSRFSKFLDACHAFNRGELLEGALVGTAAQLAFNVIDAFYMVGSRSIPVRFFADERGGNGGGGGAICQTDDLRRLAGSAEGSGLADEAEARWCPVKTVWQLDLPWADVAVQADAAQDLLVEQDRRIRRTSLIRVTER